ncbi:MAG: M23 family metallopeptidase [Elusimicrobia bacterium]|nr:M23 family metallopeptidase [Elusimicrobiota bacterium]
MFPTSSSRLFLWGALLAGLTACLGPMPRGPHPPKAAEPPPSRASSASPTAAFPAGSIPNTIPSAPLVRSTGAVHVVPRFALPLGKVRVLSPYGPRGRKFHTGIDLLQTRGGGDPVLASADGVVATVSHRGGYGRMVLLRHGDGWITRYAHLRKVTVREGQTLKQGEALGMVGGSGHATAPHLHFEILTPTMKTMNPAEFLFPPAPETRQAASPPKNPSALPSASFSPALAPAAGAPKR